MWEVWKKVRVQKQLDKTRDGWGLQEKRKGKNRICSKCISSTRVDFQGEEEGFGRSLSRGIQIRDLLGNWPFHETEGNVHRGANRPDVPFPQWQKP